MQSTTMQKKSVHFERAIFTSWYCSLGDCTYCYMSTQKSLIDDPQKAKRRMSSILAEAFIGKKLGWKIGALSAGYGSYTQESLLELCKNVVEVTKEKVWLNVGVLPEPTIQLLEPYLEGIFGAVETINPEVHKQVAPNKPIAPIERMYKVCDKYNLKKAMTFIVGMGESIDDFALLEDFIKKHKLDKVIFYALNPIKGTVFEKSAGPSIHYYLEWMQKTRQSFPDIEIVAGPWVSRVGHIHDMLAAGATSFTKFPAIKLFNSEHAKKIEQEIKKAGFEFTSTFTKLFEFDKEEILALDLEESLKVELVEHVFRYWQKMKNPKTKNTLIEVEEF